MKAFWKLPGVSEKSENGGKCVPAFFNYVMSLKGIFLKACL